WHAWEVHRWGTPFVQTYLGREVVDRMTGQLWPTQKIDSYLHELLRDDWPWLAFVLVGSLLLGARAWRGDRRAAFCVAWAAGYYAVLHASAFRRGQYLMHFYPPASLLAAVARPPL